MTNQKNKNPFQDTNSFKILECSDCLFLEVCKNLCNYLDSISYSNNKDKKKPLKMKFNIPFKIET